MLNIGNDDKYTGQTVATADLPSSDGRIVPLNVHDDRYRRKESTGICTKTLPVRGSIGAQAEDSPESSTVEPSFENDGQGVNCRSRPIPMQTRRDSTTVEQQHTPRSPAVEPSFKNNACRVSMIADQRNALTSPAGKNQQRDRVVAFPNNFRPSFQDDGRIRVVQDQGRSPRPRSVTREVSSTVVVGTDLPVSKPQWRDLRVACSLVKASRTEVRDRQVEGGDDFVAETARSISTGRRQDSEKSPDSYLGSERDDSITLSSDGTPYSGGVHSRQDEAMDKGPWRTPVQTHCVSTNPKIDPNLQVRPAAGSPNQCEICVASSFGGTPSLDGVCGNKDEAMDNSPWPAPVQTQIVSTCRQIENSPRSSIACSLDVRDTAVASDSYGTSWLCDVSEPVNQGMSWHSCLPYTPYVNSMNAKVDSPSHLTSNEEFEATPDVNHASNNASAARIKS
ncbi:hypothetical protein K439DRAFT_1618427 [Ramaria rubella]|nr:hypothetical protein K439DRAFT_1618427 [Ramaria rubella]